MWSLILYVVLVCSMYVCSMCMYVVISQIDHCIHIHWCIVMGLGHNDPWVESHMWPQQTWGQRSCRGQWPLVQVFGKKDLVYPHTLMYFSNLILQWLQKYVLAKAGETQYSDNILSIQTTTYFFRFGLITFRTDKIWTEIVSDWLNFGLISSESPI